MTYIQEPPFCIQVEPTEGCNLRCGFCGLNGIRGPVSEGLNLKYMARDTAITLANQVMELGWNSRFEFAMHGEPTLNREIVAMILDMKVRLSKNYFLMESNGAGIVGSPVERILALFGAGLSTLALDEYHNVNLVPRIREAVATYEAFDAFDQFGIEIHRYPSGGPDGNPHQRNNKKRLVFIAPIDTSTKGTHSSLNNHSGCGAPKSSRKNGTRCAKPFREISIRWDGSVAICCNDWRGYYKCGNILQNHIGDIWNGPAFSAARHKLYHGGRDFGPCDGCDAVSYRSGFLPDQKGNLTLPFASEQDLAVIGQALAGDPYSPVVLRPWELVNIS